MGQFCCDGVCLGWCWLAGWLAHPCHAAILQCCHATLQRPRDLQPRPSRPSHNLTAACYLPPIPPLLTTTACLPALPACRWLDLSPDAKHLVMGMLAYDPARRLTMQQVRGSCRSLRLTAAAWWFIGGGLAGWR
jgi:hypothetical protein